MSQADYQIIDFDNHFYEVDDCFTRFIEDEFKDKTVWVDRSNPDGIGRMMIGQERSNFFSAAVGDFVGPPGILKAFFKGDTDQGGAVNANGISAKDNPQFTHKEPRLALMDEQNVGATVMLPTLGVGIEYQMRKPEHQAALYPSLRSFNRWQYADWGWGADGRIFCAAVISLLDVDQAIAELERVLAEGCKIIHITNGPVNDHSPADPVFDPFWARVAEAGVVVAMHIGHTPFNDMYATHWGEPGTPPSHRFTALNTFMGMGQRTVVDQVAALIYHNLPGRFPGLRFAIVEYGAAWVHDLLKTLDKIWRLGDHKTRWPYGKPELPSEVFKKHFWVVPFHEDNFARLAEDMGVSQIINGSDFPHPEGLEQPMEMYQEIVDFSAEDQRRIMRSNAAGLLGLEF